MNKVFMLRVKSCIITWLTVSGIFTGLKHTFTWCRARLAFRVLVIQSPGPRIQKFRNICYVAKPFGLLKERNRRMLHHHPCYSTSPPILYHRAHCNITLQRSTYTKCKVHRQWHFRMIGPLTFAPYSNHWHGLHGASHLPFTLHLSVWNPYSFCI
jgi:hypothetical protein